MVQAKDQAEAMKELERKQKLAHDVVIQQIVRSESHRLYRNAQGANIPPMSPVMHLYHPIE